jgi:hypothetical protein
MVAEKLSTTPYRKESDDFDFDLENGCTSSAFNSKITQNIHIDPGARRYSTLTKDPSNLTSSLSPHADRILHQPLPIASPSNVKDDIRRRKACLKAQLQNVERISEILGQYFADHPFKEPDCHFPTVLASDATRTSSSGVTRLSGEFCALANATWFS